MICSVALCVQHHCRHTCSPSVDAFSIGRIACSARGIALHCQIWHLRQQTCGRINASITLRCTPTTRRESASPSLAHNIAHTHTHPFGKCIRAFAYVMHAFRCRARGLKQPYCLRINQRGFHQYCTASDTRLARVSVIIPHAQCVRWVLLNLVGASICARICFIICQ